MLMPNYESLKTGNFREFRGFPPVGQFYCFQALNFVVKMSELTEYVSFPLIFLLYKNCGFSLSTH